jgi:hypothetical protein
VFQPRLKACSFRIKVQSFNPGTNLFCPFRYDKKNGIYILSHLDHLFRACPERGMPGVVYDIVSKQHELGPDQERQKLGEQERQWAAKCLLPVFKLLQ